jgi:hypothetical protein
MQKTPDWQAAGWQAAFNVEIQSALSARQTGKEGKARVCARRAAGIAVGEYFRRQAIDFPDPSAVERLRYFQTLPGISPAAQRAASLLLLRVTPDFTLPEEVDLIAEARLLAQELLG